MTPSQEPYRTLLLQNSLFNGLSEDELDQALSILHATSSVYRRGESLLRPGQVLKSFGLVLSGAVQACTDDLDGNRQILTEVSPGNTFGESLHFLEVHDSALYIYATEDTTVLWLSAHALFLGGSDRLTTLLEKRFTAMLASRALAMNSRIQILSRLRIRDKLITYFLELSKAAGSDTFTVPLNREDMASYMGTNRSALSRELSQMKKEGLIDYYRNTFKLLRPKA